MSDPFIGEIRMFAGNFPPAGWAFCEGQLMPISENDALFNLIGTTYGGDGQETFGLPNLSGRVPVHMGTSASGVTRQIGEMAGVETVTLTVNQIPSHSHPALASNAPGNTANPTGSFPAMATSSQSGIVSYGNDTVVPMRAGSIAPAGGSQPHDNMQPFLAMNYIISLFGIYPSPT